VDKASHRIQKTRNASSKPISVADRLLGLRVRIPPEARMFVLCVLYNKDKMQSQAKAVKQSTETEQKKNPAGNMDVFVVSVVLSDGDLCDGPIPRPEESYRV
jgi:hypothetical protein